ncbi:MAG: DUF4113 domain-containing protein [Actinomycetales bacterium]|nr:DUF4113 domain-containing protein [Actinomycetales bacterium]
MHERDVISDEAGAVIEPLLPRVQGRSRPWLDHRIVVEGIAQRHGTGSVGLGLAGLRNAPHWAMKRELLSPRSTTHWAELAIAHAE